MELRELLRALRTSWLLLLGTLLVGGAVGVAYNVSQPKTYVSSTRLFVSVQNTTANNALEVGQGNSAAQQKVRSYLDVIRSSVVLQPVVDELDLPYSPVYLSHFVTVTQPLNSQTMDLSVTLGDPRQAADVADAIATSFRDYVTGELEPAAADGTSLVSVLVLEPAKAPTAPSNTPVRSAAMAGMLAGLLGGVAIALLRSSFDLRLRSVRDIEHLIDRPVVGTIGFDPNATKRPLVVQNSPRSPRAEAFRALRTNLQFLDVDHATKSLVVTSAMPSEGKSTTVANLALALAETGARVAIVDADLRKPRLAEIMGLDDTVGLTDALIGQAELDDVLQPWGNGRLSVLPAGRIPPNPSELLGSRGMQTVVAALIADFDYVLFDAPPLLPVTDAAVLSKLVDGIILVAAAAKSKRNQFKAAVENLANIDSRILGVIVTMLPTKGADAYGYGNYAAYYGADAAPSSADTHTRRAHFRRATR